MASEDVSTKSTDSNRSPQFTGDAVGKLAIGDEDGLLNVGDVVGTVEGLPETGEEDG